MPQRYEQVDYKALKRDDRYTNQLYRLQNIELRRAVKKLVETHGGSLAEREAIGYLANMLDVHAMGELVNEEIVAEAPINPFYPND